MNNQYLLSRLRSIFEAKIEYDGRTAVEFFEEARNELLDKLECEINEVSAMTFDRFNAGYMPGVTAHTPFTRGAA